MSLNPIAAALEIRQISSARDVLARLVRKAFRIANTNIFTAIAAFVLVLGLCALAMLGFKWLSDVFKEAGIPFLGGLMNLMFWLMGIAVALLVVAGKWWIIFGR